MIALNVEWIGMGQVANRMGHYQMAQLDLCGVAGIAPFYLNMSKGLDVLLAHPNADQDRVAVAGLSGGGWQTIFISSLDERVKLANPVAGYSSFKTRARHGKDLGDSEQTPNDLAVYADYTHLTAMLADRAALLTNNAYDRCCFTAGHALPPLIDARHRFSACWIGGIICGLTSITNLARITLAWITASNCTGSWAMFLSRGYLV